MAGCSSEPLDGKVANVQDTENPIVIESLDIDAKGPYLDSMLQWVENSIREKDTGDPLTPCTVKKEIKSEASENDEKIADSTKRRKLNTKECCFYWNMRKVLLELGTKEQCIAFAESCGLLPLTKKCTYHHRLMTLNRNNGNVGTFNCKRSCRNGSNVSRAANTCFENLKLPLNKLFIIMYCYASGYRQEQARKESSDTSTLSSITISEKYCYCRNAVYSYMFNHSGAQKIGGETCIVYLEVNKFENKKKNTEPFLDSHLVVGMIEKGSDDLRLEVCSNNEATSEEILPLIVKHVERGSVIQTSILNEKDLGDYGYILRPNNSEDKLNESKPLPLNCYWGALKNNYKKACAGNFMGHQGNFKEWLAEFSWKRKNRTKHLDPFDELMKCIYFLHKK